MPADTRTVKKRFQTVAEACRAVADNIDNPEREYPQTLMTGPGLRSFRYTTRVIVDGKPVEVHVKSL